MRIVQVAYNQKGKVWFDDINVPEHISSSSLRPYLYNRLYIKYGDVDNLE